MVVTYAPMAKNPDCPEVELPGVADDEVQGQSEQHVHRADDENAAPVRRAEQPGRSRDCGDRD